MTPKKLFLQELIVLTATIVHLPIAWFVYPRFPLTALLGALVIIGNIVALLWYFSLSVQLLMAYRLRRKIAKNPYVLYTAIPIIILFSALIYVWLITLFAVLQIVFLST